MEFIFTPWLEFIFMEHPGYLTDIQVTTDPLNQSQRKCYQFRGLVCCYVECQVNQNCCGL